MKSVVNTIDCIQYTFYIQYGVHTEGFMQLVIITVTKDLGIIIITVQNAIRVN